jgi:2-desacetyl-2-hydroxyethyl bacteriochlorophyllide A dehydrogenase
VLGHELAGVVRAVGEEVPPEQVGQRVAINPLVHCGACPTCQAGRPNVCPHRTLLGLQIDGGFAEEVAVPATALRSLGALSDVAGSLVEPLANAVHVTALLPAIVGREILVYGVGTIGLCVITMLRVAGAGHVVAVDPVAPRRRLAEQSGAHRALTPEDAEREGIEVDHVVDAAGVTSVRQDAIVRCRPGGTIVLLGLHTASSEMPINNAVAKELRLQCSYAYTPRDFDTALALLADGALGYERWITERPLAEGQAAFRALVEEPDEVTKIVLRPAAAGSG